MSSLHQNVAAIVLSKLTVIKSNKLHISQAKKLATSGTALFVDFTDVSRSNFRNESRPRSRMLDHESTSTITMTMR